jgi:hypothetical protein
LIVRGIVAFARKIVAENREKMNSQAVIGIDGSWNDRRSGLAHILDVVDVRSRSVVDFESVQKATASGRGQYEGSNNGMEVEALTRMVKRQKYDQKVAVVVADQDSKIAKVIQEPAGMSSPDTT